MGKRKLEELRRDTYYKMAKKEGYRSRAVYKLKEINRVFNLINQGDYVLDLGAAPGGWLQYISEVVGIDGFVLGVDLKPIKPLDKRNVITIQGDIFDDKIIDLIKENVDRKFDVITSDLSINISGIWELDVIKNIEINERVLELARVLLKPGGNIVLKLFEGKEMDKFIRKVRKYFSFIKLYKPKASRKRSSEIYLIGISYRSRRIFKKE